MREMQPSISIPANTISEEYAYSSWLKIWLAIGIVMVFFQVIIGGITRLTGSGLSITKWEIVTGTFPPLNANQWEEAFELYQATPQYQKINEGMSMSAFKFIYFWEYIHRLWARLMGFVFLIPFFYFWLTKQIQGRILRRLVAVFFLAGLVASFGWIMVASGLIDRPWVNAYKLTMHLSLAILLFGYLLWTTFLVWHPTPKARINHSLRSFGLWCITILGVQLVLGGIMSGMKAALFFPTWPLMNGAIVPGEMMNPAMWTYANFIDYDQTPFMAANIQFLHRNVAYLLLFLIGRFIYLGLKKDHGGDAHFKVVLRLLGGLLITQVLLGIFTLINAKGVIPVGLGVTHQGVAIILFAVMLYAIYLMPSYRRR